MKSGGGVSKRLCLARQAIALCLAPLAAASSLPGQSTPDRANDVVALARAAAVAPLSRMLSEHPDAGREALRQLLIEATDGGPSMSGSLEAAERVARVYFEAWSDPFPLQQVTRFRKRSPEQRRRWATIDSLRLAGNDAWVEQGVDAAMRLWQRSRGEAEQLGDTVAIARALGNLAAGLMAKGDVDGARPLLKEAYDLATATGDLLTAANASTVSANISFETGDLSGASHMYSRSLELLERTGSHRSAAANRHNLGLVAMASGDLQLARSVLREAVEASRLLGYAGDEAESLSSLAELESALGRLASADSLLRRAVELAEAANSRLAEAGTRQALGTTALARGRYREAQRELHRAVALFDSLGRTDRALDALLELSRAHASAGDLALASATLDSARVMAAQVGEDDLAHARTALAAGDLRLSLGLHAEALDDFRQAEEWFAEGNRPLGKAAALQGQALSLLTRGDLREALPLLSRTATRTEAAGMAREAAVARLQIAWTYLHLDQQEAARAIVRQVITDVRTLEDPVALALAYAVAGEVEQRGNRTASAAEHYRRGLAELGTDPPPAVASRLRAGLGRASRLAGATSEAIREFRRALSIVEHSVTEIQQPHLAAAFLANKWSIFSDLALAHLAAGDVAASFATSERMRARQALELLDRGEVAEPSTDDFGQLRRIQDARKTISRLDAEELQPRLGRLDSRYRERPSTSLSASTRDSLMAEAAATYDSLTRRFNDRRNGVASLIRPEAASITEIAAELNPDEGLIEYLVTDSAVVAFAVTSDTSLAVRLPIAASALPDLVRFARGTIERDPEGTERLWRAPLGRLHDVLLEPVLSTGALSTRSALYIAPHRELHYVPFAALIDRAGPRDRYLVERFSLTTIPSATAWTAMRRRSRDGGAATRRILAVAPHPQLLPGSRAEVRSVAARLGREVQVLEGAAATRRAVLDGARRTDVLHLASFGVLNSINPLFSYIELAADGPTADRLEVHEIFGLELDAWLVVLSACETGLGSGARSNVPVGDDWIGLQRAFLAAGARSVIATLWRVRDLSTARLMDIMYTDLERGQPVAVALASAQRTMLRDGAPPMLWAGFTLAGDGSLP